VAAEAVGSDSDAEIDKFQRLTDDERVELVDLFDRPLQQLDQLPFVLTGRLAAFVQGAPLRADRLDLLVAECDLDRFAAWFETGYCQRWNERWQDWGYDSVDPRDPGLPMRWLVGYTDIRLAVVPELPATVGVRCRDRVLRVRPLPDIEREFPDVGLLMRRVRVRAGAPEPG
jgi:hypothetical protein